MASPKKYQFDAVLERQKKGMGFHIIYVPIDVQREFGTKGSVRIVGIFNGVEMERAMIPEGNGEHFIVFGTDLRRKAAVRVGDVVHAQLQLNLNPLILDVPEELQAIFEIEPLVHKRFKAKLNNSTRRNICYWINSGKREETRTKRAIEIMNRLLKDEFDMGGKTTSLV